MKELKILDDILIQLKDKTSENPLIKEDIIWYAGHLFTTNERDKRTILEKLIKDGYADRLDLAITKDNTSIVDKYFITFDGLIFINKGGYTKQFNKDNKEYSLNRLQFWILLIGSIVAIFFGIIKSSFLIIDRFDKEPIKTTSLEIVNKVVDGNNPIINEVIQENKKGNEQNDYKKANNEPKDKRNTKHNK